MAKQLKIEVVSDVICPWCYIGKRRLEKALVLLDGELSAEIRWLPFQLNPGMPREGMPRAAYRKAKFGSVERGRQLDARVAAEGKGEGIEFAFDRIDRTPNTVAAHALVGLAQQRGLGAAVVDALFRAYFEQACDVGDAAVLADIAQRCGVSRLPQRGRDGSRCARRCGCAGSAFQPPWDFAHPDRKVVHPRAHTRRRRAAIRRSSG
jgi:predicted DsbA family dithiol-disulfide isomerase